MKKQKERLELSLNKKSLDQMAKNLVKCSKRSLEDVLSSLSEEESEYLLIQMELFRKGSSLE